jgi:hypothetical protein
MSVACFRMRVKSRRKIDRSDELYRVLRSRDFDEFDFPYPPFFALHRGYSLLSPSTERGLALRLAELAPRRIVRVSRLSYENPFGLNFNFNGEGFAKVIEVVRDWTPDREAAKAKARQEAAKARILEAQASDYEDLTARRREIRSGLTGGVLDGTLRLSAERHAAILSDVTIDSFLRLEDAGLNIQLERKNDGSGLQAN